MQMARNYSRSLWGVPGEVADSLEHQGLPVLTGWDLFALIRRAYRDSGREVPLPAVLHGISFVLRHNGIIKSDLDYRKHYRVVSVPDCPADEVVCLLDRFCHISHLSAMHRWGLTDRIPKQLIISRPDDKTVADLAGRIMDEDDDEVPWPDRPDRRVTGPFRLNNIVHPSSVRQLPVMLKKSCDSGQAIRVRPGFARVSTIGQTFLDMLRRPDLCGGMSHVLDIWSEHAGDHLSAIIDAVDTSSSVVKCRAGFIVEENLGIKNSRVEAWPIFNIVVPKPLILNAIKIRVALQTEAVASYGRPPELSVIG